MNAKRSVDVCLFIIRTCVRHTYSSSTTYLCPRLPVLVRNVECALDVAAVGILAFAVEHFAVVFVVVEVDGTVERQQDDLRRLQTNEKMKSTCGCAGTYYLHYEI